MLREIFVDKPNRYEPGLSRSTLYRVMLSAILGSVIGVFFARPILGYFQNFSPWIGPAVIAGVVGIAMIAMLILPRIIKRRANNSV
jgi:hypothetical protein